MPADDPFLWLGNHAATDLCNTAPVIDGVRVDLLADVDALVRWAAAVGIEMPVAGVTGRTGQQTLRWVRELRGALRAVLDPATRDLAAVAPLNEVLAGEAGVLEVRAERGTHAVAISSPDERRQLRLDLAAAVLDIFSHDLSLVRKCANPECVLLFLDVSKSGRRRWCDMATCGNRAKVAAHYARNRAR